MFKPRGEEKGGINCHVTDTPGVQAVTRQGPSTGVTGERRQHVSGGEHGHTERAQDFDGDSGEWRVQLEVRWVGSSWTFPDKTE